MNSFNSKIGSFWSDHLSTIHREFADPAEADALLVKKEEELGFVLPDIFKELYRMRDGGYTTYDSYTNEKGTLTPVLYQTSLHPLKEVSNDYEHGGGIGWMISEDSESEPFFLNNVQVSKIKHPERLVEISSFHGHGVLMLDYGFEREEALSEPEVVLFEENDLTDKKGLKETLRVKNFATFFNNLVRGEY